MTVAAPPVVAPAAGRATGTAGRGRDPWFDNTRLVAALLVVVGHVLTRVNDRLVEADVLWSATWAFRIPVLVLLAGWFSARELDRVRAVSLLRDVLLVYLAFDALGALRAGLVDGVWALDPVRPGFGMWFLLSLFWWRLLLPVVVHVRRLMLWSVAASVLVGFVGSVGADYSASRTVALLPLFVLGVRARQRRLDLLLRARGARVVAVVVAATVAAAGAALHDLPTRHYLMRSPYAGSVADQLADAAVRLGLLGAGTAGAVALLTLVPRRRLGRLTDLGGRSMYVYLLHLLVVAQAASLGWFDRVESAVDLAVACAVAVGVGLALASRPVRVLLGPLVQPRLTRPFQPLPATARRARA